MGKSLAKDTKVVVPGGRSFKFKVGSGVGGAVSFGVGVGVGAVVGFGVGAVVSDVLRYCEKCA